MHKDEMWQLYNENGEPILDRWWDGNLDNPENSGSPEIVGAVIIMLYRQGDDGLEFLWQRRSDKVSRHPGTYDTSAAGHVNFGETPVEAAVRESDEEIGAKVTADELRLVEAERSSANRFIWTYLVDWTGRECEFRFDDGEVSEVRWVPYAEMKEFRKNYAKKPLKKAKTTFRAIDNWLEMHGDI